MICNNVWCENWDNFKCKKISEIIINYNGECAIFEATTVSEIEIEKRHKKLNELGININLNEFLEL